MTGLLPAVEDVLERLTTLTIIRNYTLIGGTALSIQINHRLSEDIDLCTWNNTKQPIEAELILKELKTAFSNPQVVLQNPAKRFPCQQF